MRIGEKVEATRVEDVSILTSSFKVMNESNERDLHIRHSFNIYGLNLSYKDTDMFKRHLGLLSEKI